MRPIVFFMTAIVTGLVIFCFVWFLGSKGWLPAPSLALEIIAINIVITAGLYFWLSRTKDAGAFINSYLLSIVLKIGFYSFFLILVLIVSPKNLEPNAILILVCYFIFTFLEVAVLFNKVNR